MKVKPSSAIQTSDKDLPAQRPVCPRKQAPLISRAFFHWMTPFICNGFKNDITADDLWRLDEEDSVEYLTNRFRENIEAQFPNQSLSTAGGGKRGSTLKALIKTFWGEFSTAGLYKLIADGLNYSGPIFMKIILKYLTSDASEWTGALYVVSMLFCMVIQTVFASLYYYRVYALGMHVWAVVTAAIYEKSLRLSTAARRDRTVGEIVNLMSIDAQTLRDVVRSSHMVWSTPVQILAATALVYTDMGASTGASLLFMIVLLPISLYIASLQKKALAAKMKDKDDRIKIMNEILIGIRVLKLYAWELGFKKVIDGVRSQELVKLRKIAYLQALLTMLWFFAPFAISFITFAAFIFLNRDSRLTPEAAFYALAVYQNLRVPLTTLPSLISNVMRAVVSLNRFDDFLSADEVERYVRYDSEANLAITLQNASFAWEGKEPALKDINLEVKKGELLGVVGRVGEGKSSLISAILGNMNSLNGEVNVNGSIAYVSQQVWLRNTTVRGNILFGKAFDAKRYWDIIRRCALLDDFKILPAGDQTEIGEKGINLSGGQKQRISIARAIYADADTYLFDDPLSAVDTHVGLHIFSKVIGNGGILRRKTRVLVTHGIQYLPRVERVVVIKDGYLTQDGKFMELMHSQDEFRKLMRQISQPARKVGLNSDKIESITRSGTAKAMSEKDTKDGKIVEEERAKSGGVKGHIRRQYLQHIGYAAAIIVLLTMLSSTAFQVASSFWLNKWSKDESAENGRYNLMIFGLLGVGQAVGLFFGVLSLLISSLKASKQLHDRLLISILRAPVSFFDSTPTGRIVNRFARDVEILDTNLPRDIRVWVQQFLNLGGILFVICFNLPLFIAVVIPVGMIYCSLQRLYIRSFRQLRRLESISRSPLFSHFGETLQGSATIRAYGKTSEFINECYEKINFASMCYFPQIAANRWLGIRLDICASMVTFATALFVVMSRGNIDAGIAGLCLAYALQATLSLNYLIRSGADIEVNAVSVERIVEYMGLESEADWTKNTPRDDWPSEGVVEFKNYSTRYRKNLPFVVRGIDLRINAGEKVGICGRTGAGKSSLTLALFRIIEACQGGIIIDGIPIENIGLHDLRKRLSIIPQDPVLFAGPLRLNLDPFGELSDEQLWHAIGHAHLKQFVDQQQKGLDFEVAEGGENLSVGQRQLVCLARALLRNSKILVLDEATAAVDFETDAFIQETIKVEFSNCTIITIAHRIKTIINYDKILVLDAGEVREYDTPQKLLADSSSLFSEIVKEDGRK